MKIGQRVLTNIGMKGTISEVHYYTLGDDICAYTVKLDEQAPIEYAWYTDLILQFPEDLQIIED